MADVVPLANHAEFERQEVRSAVAVLRHSVRHRPTEILVIGIDADGDVFVSGQPPDPANALWLMEMAKIKLLRVAQRGRDDG